MRTRFRRMQAHQMNTPPTMVMVRKVHFVSGSTAPPCALCHESGDRKRPTVTAVKAPIQTIGKRTFMMKVSRDESRVAEDSMGLPPPHIPSPPRQRDRSHVHTGPR